MKKIGEIRIKEKEKIIVKLFHYEKTMKIIIRLHRRNYGKWIPTPVCLRLKCADAETLSNLLKEAKGIKGKKLTSRK